MTEKKTMNCGGECIFPNRLQCGMLIAKGVIDPKQGHQFSV